MKPIRGILVGIGITAMIFSPWIFGGMVIYSHKIYGSFDEWRYPSTNHFDPQRWKKPDLKNRYSALEEVLHSYIKKGMTEAKIMTILGPPDGKNAEGHWGYETKRPGWRIIDWHGGGISISFSHDGRVINAKDTRWVD